MGGDARALGRVVAIGKDRYEIVGVAPDGFTGADLSAVDVWLPLRAAMTVESGRRALETRTWWWTSAIIRLKPGVTDDTANAQMTAAHVAARREVERLGGEPYLSRGPAYLYGTSIIAARRPNPSMTSSVSLCLAAVSAIVLIIACANVANLLLTRGIQTRRELAVRAALGAPRGRLAGLVIAEAAMLAAAGAVMALIVARWSSAAARSFLPDISFSETAGIADRHQSASADVQRRGRDPHRDARRHHARAASRGHVRHRSVAQRDARRLRAPLAHPQRPDDRPDRPLRRPPRSAPACSCAASMAPRTPTSASNTRR